MTTNTINRPVLQYFGSKWRMSPKIIELFPEHAVYVEPYGGSATTLLRKPPSGLEVYNDLNEDLYNFFYCLRKYPDVLIEQLMLTPHSRQEYDTCRNAVDVSDPIERARMFFVKCWQDRKQGMKWSGWKYWKRYGAPRLPIADSLSAVAERFRNVQIDHIDAIDCIQYYDSKDTLFYIDPPYIKYGDGYEITMTLDEHKRLLKLLNGIQGYAIVSGRDDPVYSKYLMGWTKYNMKCINTNSNEYTECLWLNYTITYE